MSKYNLLKLLSVAFGVLLLSFWIWIVVNVDDLYAVIASGVASIGYNVANTLHVIKTWK